MYTDIHNHIIWGIDDGAETKEDTIRMLDKASSDQIDSIICTPHMYPGIEEFKYDEYNNHINEIREYILKNKYDIRLYTGSEVYYTDSTPRYLRERKIMPLGGDNSRMIMVEFDIYDSFQTICARLKKIATTGYVPVIAHIERYRQVRKIRQVEIIKKEYDALIQINARTVISNQPILKKRYIDILFKEGLVDFVATDMHSMPGREPCLSESMRIIQERYGQNISDMLQKNAGKLTDNV